MITGKMLHNAYQQTVEQSVSWGGISPEGQEMYTKMAAHLSSMLPTTPESEYLVEVMRTCAAEEKGEKILLAALGLAGETGEVVDLVKKGRFQGHDLDVATVKDELGDVLWYIGLFCSTLGFSLEDVRQTNIAKMHRRYPNGFETERSLNRNEVHT